MAQRAVGSFPPLEQIEVDRALGRMGLAGHDPFCWEALDWFVVFAQRDLATATEGDWLLLTEEAQALLYLVTHQLLRSTLTRDDLQGLQRGVLTVLTRLVDSGEADIGHFQVHIFIRRGAGKAAGPSQVKRLGPVLGFPAGPFAGLIGPDGANGLQYHLASLLMRWPDTVQRCPKCHRLFARFRRHAKFCSRKCQSQVAASESRKHEKAKTETKKQEREKKAQAENKKRTKRNPKGAS